VADALAMAERARTTDQVVLLGGGILNLKAAFALLEKKIQVTLVVYSSEVLSLLMYPADAFLIRKALETAGLTIMTGCSTPRYLPMPTECGCPVHWRYHPCRHVSVPYPGAKTRQPV